jgi:predicted transcriptional regulator
MKSIIDPLIADGRLIGADTSNMRNHWQRFVAADSEFAVTKEERLLEFCRQPRSRQDIAAYFEIHLKYVRQFIKPLIDDGRLKMTKPETPASIDQQYFSGDTEAPVLTADEVLAFCDMPRTRADIAERFNLLPHNAHSYIRKLVGEGRLKITNELSPASWQQGFVRAEIEVKILSAETVLEFCGEPRSMAEITEHFGINTKMTMWKYLEAFVHDGRLLRTIPEWPKHKKQRYYSA